MAKPVFYDEMMAAPEVLRPHYQAYGQWLSTLPKERLARKKAEADLTFHRLGITFAVYGEEEGTERLIPFDLLPRIIPSNEWKMLQKGLEQLTDEGVAQLFTARYLSRPRNFKGWFNSS